MTQICGHGEASRRRQRNATVMPSPTSDPHYTASEAADLSGSMGAGVSRRIVPVGGSPSSCASASVSVRTEVRRPLSPPPVQVLRGNFSARPSTTRRRVRKGLVYGIFVLLAIFCALVYSMGAFARVAQLFYLTGYGALSLGYYSMTMIFAVMNRKRVDRMAEAHAEDLEGAWAPPVSIHVVGYREDPDYFRRCLMSAAAVSYSNVRAIVISIDGNDPDDHEMAKIAMELFTGATRIDAQSDPFEDSYRTFLADVPRGYSSLPNGSIFVISQPHQGKREALYSAFKVSEKLGVEYFLNTDSDTILDPMCVMELVRMTKGRPDVGAVAGELTIFNNTNWLSRLSASRYVMAFNVERAALGYHGVVGCISGPMGLYQTSSVVRIMDKWVNQHFLGVKCSYGDERNLTNRVLALGKKVTYTHRATGETETPQSYPRFVAQQTRWSKSFWREMYCQLRWARCSWYSIIDMLYGLMFPILITVTVLTIVFIRTWWSVLAIAVMTVLIPFLRASFVFVFLKRDRKLFLNIIYPLLYFSTLLPIKFFALFTMKNNSWGTSSRKKIVNSWCPVVPVFLWVMLLLVGLLL